MLMESDSRLLEQEQISQLFIYAVCEFVNPHQPCHLGVSSIVCFLFIAKG